ncbi:hypothetical protein [Nocardia sp. XZ_19_385]|uniref:hypothetical protein n=1 Tax=Nocardia sp. XZ_19_385 TaxID=2769488 RepID=UPI00188E5E9D|nr:hypothetical protein [Nocardia sp. XZ_19_385]
MDSFTVDVSSLAGFKLDLQDLGTTFEANASRLLPGVLLPSGSSGLIASLAPAFEKFRSAVSAAQQTDLSAVGTAGENLSTAVTKYLATDGGSAKALSAASVDAFGDVGASSQPNRGAKRFNGLQLPSLSEVPEEQYTVRQVVTNAIGQLSSYDEPLQVAIGIKPTADYLTPLEADWEALQAIGKRIGLLGVNDYVASQNLSGGGNWLRSSWSGTAADTFTTTMTTLVQRISERSTDLEQISKIVQNGGECLERHVYNQAMALSSGLLQPMNYLGFNLPLAVWARLVNQAVDASMKGEIISAVDSLKKSVESRKSVIATLLERLVKALEYSPGRALPTFDSTGFEVPEKLAVDLGATRYGYGDNVWWENSIA